MHYIWPLRAALAALLLHGCAAQNRPSPRELSLFDPTRARQVPVIIYGARTDPSPLAVISHGYGLSSYQYSFIADALTARGFVVAAIQHDLPGDPAPATTGDVAILRRPIWLAGVDNITFAIDALRAQRVADQSRVILIGHSQGGDISMLFAELHPERAQVVFSLDHRRMRMPRTRVVRLCSMRSGDFPADADVIPTPEERREHNIEIYPSDIAHDMMSDSAGPNQRQTILLAVDHCLGSTQ